MQGNGTSRLGTTPPIMTNAEAQKYYGPGQTLVTGAPRTTVTSLLEQAHTEATALLESIDRMGLRVSPVLDCPLPENEMCCNSVGSSEPTLIDVLDSLVQRLRLATMRIGDMTDRVRI